MPPYRTDLHPQMTFTQIHPWHSKGRIEKPNSGPPPPPVKVTQEEWNSLSLHLNIGWEMRLHEKLGIIAENQCLDAFPYHINEAKGYYKSEVEEALDAKLKSANVDEDDSYNESKDTEPHFFANAGSTLVAGTGTCWDLNLTSALMGLAQGSNRPAYIGRIGRHALAVSGDRRQGKAVVHESFTVIPYSRLMTPDEKDPANMPLMHIEVDPGEYRKFLATLPPREPSRLAEITRDLEQNLPPGKTLTSKVMEMHKENVGEFGETGMWNCLYGAGDPRQVYVTPDNLHHMTNEVLVQYWDVNVMAKQRMIDARPQAEMEAAGYRATGNEGF